MGLFCTRGRSRTGTRKNTSLSRARLPIPPLGHTQTPFESAKILITFES
jgi:hypothetical protein